LSIKKIEILYNNINIVYGISWVGETGGNERAMIEIIRNSFAA
jgi:hypothetical protein